jgi:hypothetical protein
MLVRRAPDLSVPDVVTEGDPKRTAVRRVLVWLEDIVRNAPIRAV